MQREGFGEGDAGAVEREMPYGAGREAGPEPHEGKRNFCTGLCIGACMLDLILSPPLSAGPPSTPRNVSFSLVGTQLSLWWQPPSDHGGRKDLTYSISCQRCSVLACEPCEASVVFSPSASGLNNTSIDVDGLEAYTNYSFTVKARNGVSEVSPFPQRTSPAVWVSVGHAGESPRWAGE